MTVICIVLTIASCAEPRGPLVVGESLPIRTKADRPAVVWVFNADRCLGCTLTDPARTLRRIHHRFGDAMEMVAIAISDHPDHHESLVGSFLRSQRLDVRLEMQSQADHAIGFGLDAPEPVVYLADAKRIIGIFTLDLDGLADQVESILID